MHRGHHGLTATYKAPANGDVFGDIYLGKTHEKDLTGDINDKDSPFRIDSKLFSSALDVWLSCSDWK